MVSPVCPTPSWKIGDKADDPLALYLSTLNSSANLAGIPACRCPGGFSSDGLPIGMELRHRLPTSTRRACCALPTISNNVPVLSAKNQ